MDLLKIAGKNKYSDAFPIDSPNGGLNNAVIKKNCRLGKSRKCVVTWILYDAHTLSPNQLQKLIVALFLGTGTGGKGEPPSIQLANTQPLPVV